MTNRQKKARDKAAALLIAIQMMEFSQGSEVMQKVKKEAEQLARELIVLLGQ